MDSLRTAKTMGKNKSGIKRYESMLESDYISQLNKEKDEHMKAYLHDPHPGHCSNILTSLGSLSQNETRKQRKNRHREHLAYLMGSKREQMKRRLLELIDNIHTEEQQELSIEINKIADLMREWQKEQYEPINFDVVIVQKLQQIEKNRLDKLQFKEQLAQCDTYTLTKEKLKQLSDLCKQYGMVDYTKTNVPRDDRQLIDQFVNGTSGAFQAYKLGSSINRTLLNCNYKQKEATEDERKIQEVIEYERCQVQKRDKKSRPRFTLKKITDNEDVGLFESSWRGDAQIINQSKTTEQSPRRKQDIDTLNMSIEGQTENLTPRQDNDFFKTNVYLSENNMQKILTPNSKSWHRPFNRPSLPTLGGKEKERGGGGLIYPKAPFKLLETLKQPKNSSSLNNKLLHNNRVFSHFLDKKSGAPTSTTLNFRPNDQIQKLKCPEIPTRISLDQLKMKNMLSPTSIGTASAQTPASAGHGGGKEKRGRYESFAKQELNRIVEKCRQEKGNSHGEMSEDMENLRVELGIQVLRQQMHQIKLKETAEKIQIMEDNLPNILKTVYAEDKTRIQDQSQDEIIVLKAFEHRKRDTKYFQMLERRK